MTEAECAAFQALFEQVEGYKLSHKARNEGALTERSFVYGEVLPLTFQELLARAKPVPGERFFDLGCGVGKAVIAAAMQFPFAELTGVERLPGLAEAARKVVAEFDRKVRPTLHPAQREAAIQILEGDFLEIDLSSADIVFAHASCFEQKLLHALVEKLARELRPSARVVVVGRSMFSLTLEQTFGGKCQMDWGEAVSNVYVRNARKWNGGLSGA